MGSLLSLITHSPCTGQRRITVPTPTPTGCTTNIWDLTYTLCNPKSVCQVRQIFVGGYFRSPAITKYMVAVRFVGAGRWGKKETKRRSSRSFVREGSRFPVYSKGYFSTCTQPVALLPTDTQTQKPWGENILERGASPSPAGPRSRRIS